MNTTVKNKIGVAVFFFVCLFGEMVVSAHSEAMGSSIEDQIVSFVAALEKNVNARDVDGVRSMFLHQATNQVPRVPDEEGDKLRLEVMNVDASTNLSADVRSYLLGSPDRKQIVHIEIVQTENGLRIRSASDKAAARRNAEFEQAVIAAHRLALAINRLDTNEVCRLTGIPESVRRGGGRAVAAVLEKRKMSWICEAMRQRFGIQYSGVGRLADDDLRARLLEFGAGGVTNAKHVLQFKVDHFTHGENDLPLSP